MTKKLSASQEKLHRQFQEYGRKHLEARRLCIGLLPQIFAEKIYVKKGFDSIYEYAGKLAGLSREQVKRALSLHARFADKPLLRGLLTTGEVSLNKLAKVASVATAENEAALADQIRLLPCRAVETLVRDISRHRVCQESAGPQEDDGQKPLFANIFVHVNKVDSEQPAESQEILRLKLSARITRQLLELQNKGIDLNDMIAGMLIRREQEISEEKAKLARHSGPAKTRYVQVAIRKVLRQEHGNQCSSPGCNRRAETLHHTLRLALGGTHNPHFLAPLCREHHRIAHSIDLKYHEFSQGKQFRGAKTITGMPAGNTR